MACTAGLVYHFASGSSAGPGSPEALDHQKEGVRLASYRHFPPTVGVFSIRLAQAGFFYTGRGDTVQCFSCGVTHQGWHRGDRPGSVHARISPTCPLVTGQDTANLPLPLPLTTAPTFTSDDPVSVESGYGSGSYSGSVTGASATGAVAGGASAFAGVAAGGSVGAMASAVAVGASATATPQMQTDAELDNPRSVGATSMMAPYSRLPASSMLAPSSLQSTAATIGPTPSRDTTPENSLYSGAPLGAVATTTMDSGAPGNLPMPGKRLDLGGAVYPLYSQMDARKRSFSSWVEDEGLPGVDLLITLGFFYAGYADCVRCFFCGIGLKSWEPGDIPAEVHARWRPTCEYLRLVKGDQFVDQVANGGRNVLAGEANGANNAAPNRSVDAIAPARVDAAAQGAPGTVSEQPRPAAAPAADIPDIPVVRRARETGYTNQQIAEGIAKLRLIGMERAIDVMLVEVLTNLFRDHPPAPAPPAGEPAVVAPGNNNASEQPAAGRADIEDDGVELEADVADNADASLQPADPGGAADPLRERHNVLQQENARLRGMRTCQRCHAQPVGVIFLPCGHILACSVCAPNIRRCLRCDQVIRATANVFFS